MRIVTSPHLNCNSVEVDKKIISILSNKVSSFKLRQRKVWEIFQSETDVLLREESTGPRLSPPIIIHNSSKVTSSIGM